MAGEKPAQEVCPVRVVARFRPPVSLEETQEEAAFSVSDGVVESADLLHCFRLDGAFSQESDQEELYKKVGKPLVQDVLAGYNGTILAYGPTGSGKTFCMFGPHGRGPPESAGLVPRAVHEVLDFVREKGITLECSFYEVYLEKVRDFLAKLPGTQLKELPGGTEELSYKKITTVDEALEILRLGLKLRVATNTKLNEHSSRSHAIFTMLLRQEDADGIRQRKLTLVDLAGSEKVRESGSVGGRLEEAKKINSSLSALGHVIEALADRRPHVPYRDSRLTRLLEESLGGNCRTTLLVACSPVQCSETLSSLRFAARAKKVENMVGINISPSQFASTNSRLLERRIAQLRRELARLEGRRARERSSSVQALERPQGLRTKSASPAPMEGRGRLPPVSKEKKEVPEALPLPTSVSQVTLAGSCRSTATGTSSSGSVAISAVSGSGSGTPLSRGQREESPCPHLQLSGAPLEGAGRGGYSFIIEATPLDRPCGARAPMPYFQTQHGATVYLDLQAQPSEEQKEQRSSAGRLPKAEKERGRSTASCASRLAMSMAGEPSTRSAREVWRSSCSPCSRISSQYLFKQPREGSLQTSSPERRTSGLWATHQGRAPSVSPVMRTLAR